MISFVLWVVPNNHDHLGFLPLSLEAPSSFIKRGLLFHLQDFKSVWLLTMGSWCLLWALFSSLTWVALHFYNQRQGRSWIHFSTRTQTFHSMRDVDNCFGREQSPLKNQKPPQYFRQFITAVSRRGFYQHVWRSLHCCNIQHYIRLQRAVGKCERLSFPWTSEWLLYYASGEWQC